MPRDDRTYIRLHDGMPDHPKVEGLSDAAFRLLVRVWCRCSIYRTDGLITEAWWAKQKPRARQELLDAKLVEPTLVGDGVIAHDYDQHQRTAAEIEQFKVRKAEAGAKGAHQKWHVKRGIVDPDCEFCTQPGAMANR